MPRPTMSEPTPATMGELSRSRTQENERAQRNEHAANAQHSAHAKAPEAAHADRRADWPSEHHRGERETADQRRLLHHALNEHRQKRSEPDHHHAGQKRGGVGGGDRPAPPKLERNHRLRRPALLQDEQNDRNQCDESGQPNFEPPRGRNRGEIGHDGGDGDGEYAGAQMIDPAAAADALFVQKGPEPGRSERADRQVHPEDPGPGKILDDETAGQRPQDCGHRPDAGEPALDLPPLMRRIEIADDGHGGRLNRARADALHQPEDDQRRHRPREPA